MVPLVLPHTDEATEEVTLTVLHPVAEKKDLYASARRRVASCE